MPSYAGWILGQLGFGKAQPAATGRPPYDPGDLLRLCTPLYGYLNQVRSLRRLERECGRNVELMWPLNRAEPGPQDDCGAQAPERGAL
jgi:transposase